MKQKPKPDSQILAAIIGVVGLIIVAVIGSIFGKTIIQVVYPPIGVTLTSTAVARTTPTNHPPTATPSPTPTLITITKNLDIPCINGSFKVDVKLTTIVIDTTQQKSTWNFTLTNNDKPITYFYFSTLELEDNTGQKHQGGGLASTDGWNMSSGQSIQTYATFDVVHATKYLLNLTSALKNFSLNLTSAFLLDYLGCVYQTETITF